MKTIAHSTREIQQPFSIGFEESIREGRQMAEIEGEAALESIELRRSAETRAAIVEARHIEATGQVMLQRRDAVQTKLQENGFDVARHLHEMARGRVDLIQAIGLLTVSAALALYILLAFGPGLLSILLALVIVGSAGSIEEFFSAHAERDSTRQGIFLVTSALALAAQFWFGVARGKLMATSVDAGPISHMLSQAGPIVQTALGILGLVTEVLCGWKFYRARTALLSPSARAYRERERLNAELANLGRTLEATNAAPDIRRHARIVGMRQQLAWATGAEQRARATHLKRAAKGALIALAILAALFILASRLSAAPNPGQNKIVLIDVSRSVSPESFRANIGGVTELIAGLQSGDHIIIVPITDKFGAAIVLDEKMPDEPGYMKLQERAAREAVGAKWMNISKTLKPTYGRTDLLGALSALQYLGDVSVVGAHVFIFSDLQQCTLELDLEHAPYIAVAQTIAKLKQTNAIARLDHAEIYSVGVDPTGKSARYYATLRQFWFEYFREAGAELKRFSIDRKIPSQ